MLKKKAGSLTEFSETIVVNWTNWDVLWVAVCLFKTILLCFSLTDSQINTKKNHLIHYIIAVFGVTTFEIIHLRLLVASSIWLTEKIRKKKKTSLNKIKNSTITCLIAFEKSIIITVYQL